MHPAPGKPGRILKKQPGLDCGAGAIGKAGP